ncbi:MAG: hypothetical protein JOY99_08350 [Sphingomonadaceae bacterium]|nr:hypothetical protein [Sphingomonadaceae bacterium]
MPLIRTNTLHPTGEEIFGHMEGVAPGSVQGPLVSCLMVTHGDRPAVREAILGYQRQTYRNRELVIVTIAEDNLVPPLLAELGDPSIRHHRAAPTPLGTLRNVSVDHAAGALLCLWDDDDLYHPLRIEFQLAALNAAGAAACFLSRWVLWQIAAQRIAYSAYRLWEGSMLIRREAMLRYPPLARGEDTELLRALRSRSTLVAIDVPGLYCYVQDGTNTWQPSHFEGLMARATQRFEGEQYRTMLADLSQAMPIAARAARLSLAGPPAAGQASLPSGDRS